MGRRLRQDKTCRRSRLIVGINSQYAERADLDFLSPGTAPTYPIYGTSRFTAYYRRGLSDDRRRIPLRLPPARKGRHKVAQHFSAGLASL